MATAKQQAAARKPTKRRGPTKAAALKALGLTQADLDAIKDLKELGAQHGASPMQSVPESVREVAEDAGLAQKSKAQQRAKEATYDELVKQNSEIPADLARDVESQRGVPNPASTGAEGPQTFFIRNLRLVEVGIRLERQSDQKTKRIDLKPRGTRGDIKPLQEGDLQDSTLIANVELGVVEIITAAEAQKAIKNQVNNAQTAIHPAMAMLRNPLGEEYADGAVQGVEDYVDESVVVARLTPVGGEFGEIAFNRENRGSFDRAPQEQGRSLGGNPHILSDGFAAARAADEVARSKTVEGPAAGLGGIQTVVIDQPKEVRVPKPKGS